MTLFNALFKTPRPIIGMIHLQALPGSPLNTLNPQQIIDIAMSEAQIYAKYGIDGIMIENMHDVPYLNRKASPETMSLMAIIGYQLKQQFKLPVGIQILAGANIEALGVAVSAGLDFIRAEGFVFGHIADEGYMDSCAAELLRYRTNLKASGIAILTDIKKKHSSHTITHDVSIAETAKAAGFFLSDGLIVTGISTGSPVPQNDLMEVKKASHLPVLIGSGIEIENIGQFYALSDGFIIGSHFKTNGQWQNPVDEGRVKRFMQKINELQI